MEPLYLVDGSGYIFRAYYAIAPLSNAAGLPTNALFGFTRMLNKLLRDVQAKHIAVTFDAGSKTFRNDLYDQYKANRKECPADLVPQMPYFRRIVEAFGIKSLEKVGFEADDIIGTLTKRITAAGGKVVIISGDKDLLQLVGENVRVHDAMRDIEFTPEAVKTKFGVHPHQIRDYLALIGDTSDNIPGLRGVGPKSAERLIEHFGSIENLIEKAHEIETLTGLRGAKGLREKVELGIESLRLSLRLVTLDTDVEPFNRTEKVEEFLFEQVRADLIEPLFAELEFTNMLSSMNYAGSNGVQIAIVDPYANKKFQIITQESLADFAMLLADQPRFAFDTETSSLDVLSADLMGMSFSWKKDEAYYLPLLGRGAEGRTLDAGKVRELLNPIFSNPQIQKVGHNLKFDISILEEQGYTVRGSAFDSMLASHLLHPDRRQNGLKPLAQFHLRETMVTYEEMVKDFEVLGDVPLDTLAKYAAHDADASWALSEILNESLGEPDPSDGPSMRKAYEEIEVPLVEVLSRMERNGIRVDDEFLASLGEEFSGELKQLETDICAAAGKEFNLNSPKQLSVVLFEDLKLPTAGVKKNQGGYSTDANVLSRLTDAHPIANMLLDYRELHKLNSTYVEALRRIIHPKTGRIHSSFNQAIAATGRLSSTDPNLQNIPIKNPRGRKLRRAFIADPGSVLLSVDYSQIELRILGHLAGDKNLMRAFIEGEDIHARTADEIFGAKLASAEERKELRRMAKTINFGIVYGMGAFRLANELGVSRKQAQKYIDDYFGRYPRVLEYFDSLRASIESRGYVETLFGRRRFVSEIDTTGRDSGYAERSLLNAPIQGTAAEIIKLAMIKLHRTLEPFEGKAKMLLQVHDELVFEVEENIVSEVKELVIATMENAVQLDVPLRMDVRCGTSWGEDVC